MAVAVAGAVAVPLAVAVAPADQDNAPQNRPKHSNRNTSAQIPRTKTTTSKPNLWPQNNKLETKSLVPKQKTRTSCTTDGVSSCLGSYKLVSSCLVWGQRFGFELFVLGPKIWFRALGGLFVDVFGLAPKIWFQGVFCSNTDLCRISCSFLCPDPNVDLFHMTGARQNKCFN